MSEAELTLPVSPAGSTDRMEHGVNYALHYNSDYWDDVHQKGLRPTYYENLIKSAKSSIKIWDPWAKNTQDDGIMESVTCGLEIVILTNLSSEIMDNHREYADRLWGKIADEYKEDSVFKYCFVDSRKYGQKYFLHDRFLIIDDSRVFLVGASLSMQVSHFEGLTATTGIYELTEDEDIRIVKEKFRHSYLIAENDGTIIVKPDAE